MIVFNYIQFLENYQYRRTILKFLNFFHKSYKVFEIYAEIVYDKKKYLYALPRRDKYECKWNY